MVKGLSSGGGGTSSLFPNGVEYVTTSRDFQSSDAGKLLVLINASLTMPVGLSIFDNKQLGVLAVFNSSTIETSPGNAIALYTPNTGQPGEILLLESSIQELQSTLTPISSFTKNGKTALKFLMDNMGSNSLFPNGFEFVTTSRDFQSSDAGKRLFISGDSTVLSMPEVSPFIDGDIVGIIPDNVDASFTTEFGGSLIYPLKNGDGSISECVVLIATEINSTIKLFPISTSIILDVNDNKLKTAIHYFYDNLGGGSSALFLTKTKAEIDALISTNALVKGATYKITGVHPTLYDDGTTSGTTIILKAISENVLETQGTGIFYNPKYNQAVDGFGIWDNKMYGTLTSIVGQFDYINKEGVTANNGATGVLLADGMIQFGSGDWSAATSITGAVSGATANIAGFVSPSYGVGDKVIWGGYSWTNVNGNIGASTDVLNLNSEWTKDFYDTTNYNIAYDLIEYDYTNDFISRRYAKENNLDVKINKVNYDIFINNIFIYSPIAVQQFGNVFDAILYKGIINKDVDNGYDESINFSGSYQQNLTFGKSSYQSNLSFGKGYYQQNLTFGQFAYQYNLSFGQNSYQGNLSFGQESYQSNLSFGENSYQSTLTFGENSYQQNLSFGENSYQSNLSFGESSNQYSLSFGENSYQSNLSFGESSNQYSLSFGENSYQSNLSFGQGSQLNYDSQTLLSNMSFVNFRTKSVIIPILTAATYIFDGNIKEVYQRPDGTLKLTFMNNIDILQIQLITD